MNNKLEKLIFICTLFVFSLASIEGYSQKQNLNDLEVDNSAKIAQKKAKKEIFSYYNFCISDLKENREFMTQTKYRNVVRTNKRLWSLIEAQLTTKYKNNFVLFLNDQRMELENYKQKISDEIFKGKVGSLNSF